MMRALIAAALVAGGLSVAAAQTNYIIVTPDNVATYKLPDETTLDLIMKSRILDARGAEIGMVSQVLGDQTGQVSALAVSLTSNPASQVVVPYADLQPQIQNGELVFTSSLVAENLQALPAWQ